MTTMKERLQADLSDAMRAKDDIRRSTLRMLIAAVKNAEIAAMHPLGDSEVVAVTRSQAKQRNDS
ncbi:MAG: GatB/YqeY domain-containing protein, partial [Hyphomicrobium sp.]|nr:GatB/YqeY domain-containing protein [Hyphomicrobium sp.]